MFLGIREQLKFTLEINHITIPLMDNFHLLEVTIDSKLKFDDLMKALCQTASKNVSTCSRMANYLNSEKGKIIYDTFAIYIYNII